MDTQHGISAKGDIVEPSANCLKCEYTSNNEDALKIHVQTAHKSVEVVLKKEGKNTDKYVKIRCDLCEYECKFNKQLDKHIQKKHRKDDTTGSRLADTRTYTCETCDFTTVYVAQLWEHMVEKHPPKEFAPRTAKDTISSLLAEQNIDLMEEVISLKNGFKGSFEQLAGDMDKTLREIHETAVERDDENKTLIRSLMAKVELLENNNRLSFVALAKDICSYSDQPKSSTSPPQGPPSAPGPLPKKRSSPAPPPAPQASRPAPPPAAETINRRTEVKKTVYMKKPKVLFVADSVGRNVNFNKLERATNTRIKSTKAYSSENHNAARWPEKNVTDVTKKELAKNVHNDGIDVLVLSAPTVDVTNLDTSKLRPSDNIEFFKQEVINSSKNMISVAENALRSNNELKKVVIMCHPPRFDTKEVDPLSLKHSLAKIANANLHQVWLDSPLKDKIFIGEHKLDCSNKTHLLRFTDERTQYYDGIHLFSKSGKRAYTESVLSILEIIKTSSSTPAKVTGYHHTKQFSLFY